jgi:hypothetical protein
MFKKGAGVTEVLMPGQEAKLTSEADETTKNSLPATAG